MFLSIALLTSPVGLEFDMAKSKFRAFNQLFGIRIGKWKDLSPYSSIIVLSKRKKMKRLRFKMAFEDSIPIKVHEVYLTNKHHVKRLPLATFNTKERADAFAKEYAEVLQRPVEPYNPTRSQATLNRIRRRR